MLTPWTQTFPAPPPVLGPPVNLGSPSISGPPTIGSVLTVTSDGTWARTTSSATYQWANNSGDIVGATTNGYTSQPSDNGLNVFCKVTRSNAAGSTTANSNSIAIGATGPSLDFSDPNNSMYEATI